MFKIVLSLCLIFPLFLTSCQSGEETIGTTRIVVPGSGTCEQILNALASAFNARNPGLHVSIPKSTGTSGGVKAVSEGVAVLGRVGRPLKKAELEMGLTFIPFADDAVVFAVGRRVDVDQISTSQLADIFRGNITDWEQLGGSQGPIRVMIRQADETSLSIIRKNLPLFQDIAFCDQAKMAFHDYEMVDLLNKFPTSIGFLTMSSVVAPDNTMKPVGVGGIHPTPENLSSGIYPFKAKYGLIRKKGKSGSPENRFLDFIFSAEGRSIIQAHGLIPVGRNP